MKLLKKASSNIPEGLFTVAGNRDRITTSEYASSIGKADQTVRKNYCLTGEAYGIKPIKVGNRLLWDVQDIARLLRGEI